jgi:hypothetical protein
MMATSASDGPKVEPVPEARLNHGWDMRQVEPVYA